MRAVSINKHYYPLILLLTAAFFANNLVYAQRKSDVKSKPKEEQQKEREQAKIFSYGITTNTNSGILGGFVLRHSQEIDRRKGKALHRYAALELVNIKHEKEKTTSNIIERVIYGKTNYLFNFRPEYGREFMLFGSNSDEGIAVSTIVAFGPSIGILKPYYIKYQNKTGDGYSTVQFNPDIQTDMTRIIGSASIWQNMFTNLKLIPGAHLKLAANIDGNTFGDKITGVEIGFTADYFLKTPEIMASQLTKNSRIYTAGYLTLYLGNKKRKK